MTEQNAPPTATNKWDKEIREQRTSDRGQFFPVTCSFSPLGILGAWALCLLPLASALLHVRPALAQRQDMTLQVGIVQRFGGKSEDELTLKANSGDRLTLYFEGGNGEPQTLQTQEVKLKIAPQALQDVMLDERVVFGNYRSFEDAEESAAQWRSLGIEVEITQPDRWQVWAKREVYSTPLLRRLLLQSLQERGYETVYLDSQLRANVPQAYWVLNHYRYNRDRLEISSDTGTIQVKADKEKETPFERYQGSLRLQPNAYGDYTLVNNVPLETYLRGVVPHEMEGGAPDAAQEAQAIVARTYALRNLRRFAADNYQLCADVNCQVYKGLEGTVEWIDRAIAATAGLVLTYDNELVDALYSASTGGVTAPFEEIWDGSPRPYLRGVVDSVSNIWDLPNNSLADEQNFRRFMGLKKGFNEEDWDTFRWREETSLEEMTGFLKYYLQRNNRPVNFDSIQEVRVAQRSNAGRVLIMAVKTDAGVIEIPKDEIRNAFYPPISTLFYLEPIYKEEEVVKENQKETKKTLWGYTFVGGGFGHGVGMSQSGAYKLAELGWSSDRILQFYYPGTQIRAMDESIVFWQEPK